MGKEDTAREGDPGENTNTYLTSRRCAIKATRLDFDRKCTSRDTRYKEVASPTMIPNGNIL